MLYAADFETTTDKADCRVWAWGLCAIEEPENTFVHGNTLSGFFEVLQTLKCPKVYFHNLKFDGSFIIDWLFKAGFQFLENTRKLPENCFSTLITDLGQFYMIKCCLMRHSNHVQNVEFRDSLKIFPNMDIEKIAADFDIGLKKLEIDYHEKRLIGHELTDLEIAYLKSDVMILAKALDKTINGVGLNKLTLASSALASFKGMLSMKFERLFPPPDYDGDIRQAYKGGFTYVNKAIKGKDLGPGIVLDVNSLYPYVMASRMIPYGQGLFFTGQYKPDKIRPLYVQQIRCSFQVKPGFIPTIQLKRNLSYQDNEYIEKSEKEEVLTLTSVDLQLFLEHYDVLNLEYLSGWKFKGSEHIFETYVRHWSREKIRAKNENNASLYTMSKRMLNSLYGKLATNPEARQKFPFYSEQVVKYKTGPKEHRAPVYVPAAAFITAYAREITIRAAQSLYSRFLYADTDSLHLSGLEMPAALQIHDTRLGAWKHEGSFQNARFIRQKCYVEIIGDELKVTCAGMPKACHKFVTWQNFKNGSKFPGKLVPKKVPGGTVLVETDFTIKEGEIL